MGSSKAKEGKSCASNDNLDCGKYARYTQEQVEILERVYSDCPKPSSSRRQQLIRECPILANIGHKQLKVWFQNRRCREKQRKETSRLQNWNSKLNAMNQLLLEENERLQKQATQLSSENQYLRQQLHVQQPNNIDANPHIINPVVVAAVTDTSSESVVTNGQHQHSPQHPSQEWSLSQLSIIAEKTLAEFLSKATSSVVDGIPLPGMKPGPDSIGAFALRRLTGVVAAQACALIDLEAFKVAEIVKNRSLWLQDCRRQDILASFTADRGGLVELVHTQMYAPTTLLDAPCDFWTLRYTCCMEDGSLVVCERSLAAGQGIQEIPIMPGFVRAEMLTSGFLIRPYEHGGSMVMVIDDLSFKSCNLMEGFRPLYGASAILARRMTCKVLFHLKSIAKENFKSEIDIISDPTASLRGFGHRLIRGFNDAVNCFPDEGWVSIINDGPSTVSIHINPPSNGKQFGSINSGSRIKNGIICAKASLLLQGVPPPLLLQFLKERWISWADFGTETNLTDSTRTNVNDLSKKKFSSVRVLQPIIGQEEVLEVMRIQRSRSPSGDILPENFLLQLCSIVEEIQVGEYSQLIFAPIDASVPDDAPLLPSGFRIMHLNGSKETSSQTLDLASSLEDRSMVVNNRIQVINNSHSLQGQSSIVTIAFQYMYKVESRDVVALNVQRHVQALVDILQQAGASLRVYDPAPMIGHPPTMTGQCSMEALVLVQQIVDSYRSYLCQDLLQCIGGGAEGLFRSFWTLKDSIVCCAWKPLPEFIFANQAALDMLETNPTALRGLSLDQMFNDGSSKTDYSQPPPFILKEGYACLPSGICLTSTGHPVSFDSATGWKVITNDKNAQVAAFMFCNWSFSSVPS